MGHARITEMATLFTRRANDGDKFTLKELVAESLKRGFTVRASEGEYTEADMIATGFEVLLDGWYRDKAIKPILSNRKDADVFALWHKWELTQYEDITQHFDTIRWRKVVNEDLPVIQDIET